jgi:hypothetical protein
MVDRPILFSAPMVRALLDGRKSQTRRILKPQPFDDGYYEGVINMTPVRCHDGDMIWRFGVGAVGGGAIREQVIETRFQTGDRLWVKERCFIPPEYISDRDMRDGADTWPSAIYAADDIEGGRDMVERCRWRHRTSIHCPRSVSRLTLTVTDVRVERLQDISEADADAEGFGGDYPHVIMPHLFPDAEKAGCLSLPECYGVLWDSINGAGSWEANPWVVAVSFDCRKGNIDAG